MHSTEIQCAAGVRSAVRTYVRYSKVLTKLMDGSLTCPAPVLRMYHIWITDLNSRVQAAWLEIAFSTPSTLP